MATSEGEEEVSLKMLRHEKENGKWRRYKQSTVSLQVLFLFLHNIFVKSQSIVLYGVQLASGVSSNQEFIWQPDGCVQSLSGIPAETKKKINK